MAINTVINTNMMALTAHRNLGTVGNRQNKSNQRLSSGKKINSAADDAAGLAISEKMKAQIKGLDMAAKNSEDAISLIQTAEGSLTEVNNMLTRTRELAVQAANGTNQQEDRVKIAQEVAELMSEIDAITERTEFNEKKLNDGSFKDEHFQIGANGGQKLNISIGRMDVKGLGLDALMETFGIEGGNKDGANVKATIRNADGKIVEEEKVVATKHQVSELEIAKTGTTDFAENDELTATIVYKNSKGELKTITGDTKATNGNKGDFDQLLSAALGGKTDFEDFKLTYGTDNKFTFDAIKEGAEGKFEILSVSISNKADPSKVVSIKGKGDITEGYDKHIKYADDDIKEGSSITVGGKTFNIVATADDIVDPSTDYAIDANDNGKGLEEMFAKAGIKAIESESGTGVKFVRINKGYAVSDDRVSDTGADYSDSLKVIDKALKNVTSQRAKLGANQNRLEYTIKNLELSSENLNAARSRIEDTDMAKEMMNLTQANVLQQAATSILAQANQAPQSITQLLG